MGKIPTLPTGVQNLNTADTTILRTVLSKCVGKVCAYHKVGKFEDSKAWAHQLTQELKRYGLI